MVDILAENLSGKAGMGADGTELGDLYNITMDLKTGRLHDLLVTPNEGISAAASDFPANEEGRLEIPAGAVDAVKDYIVVSR